MAQQQAPAPFQSASLYVGDLSVDITEVSNSLVWHVLECSYDYVKCVVHLFSILNGVDMFICRVFSLKCSTELVQWPPFAFAVMR